MNILGEEGPPPHPPAQLGSLHGPSCLLRLTSLHAQTVIEAVCTRFQWLRESIPIAWRRLGQVIAIDDNVKTRSWLIFTQLQTNDFCHCPSHYRTKGEQSRNKTVFLLFGKPRNSETPHPPPSNLDAPVFSDKKLLDSDWIRPPPFGDNI